MPDFLMDYHLWWLAFWSDNPVLFWVVVAVCASFGIWVNRKRRSKR